MKIAVCLSGDPGTWEHTAGSLKTFFEGHDVTTYLHLWKGETDPKLMERMSRVYGPRKTIVKPRTDFTAQRKAMEDRFGPFGEPSSFDMFTGIGQSLKRAVKDKHEFDLVARVRPDSMFKGTCPPGLLKQLQSDDQSLATPNYFTPPNGCNDQFALGHPKAMRVYSRMIEFLARNVADRETLPDALFDPPTPEQRARHPEAAPGALAFRPGQALLHYLEGWGLKVLHEDLSCTLLAPIDVGKNFNDLPKNILAQRGERSSGSLAQISRLAGIPRPDSTLANKPRR